MPFQLEPEQSKVLEHEKGTLLLTGPPGSGKTFLLRERFARLVEAGTDPERILLFTLNRRAAREARDQLIRRLQRSVPDLPVLTAHGFAFGVLGRRFQELDYEAPPQVLSAPEQYGFVRDMLLEERAADWPVFGELVRVRGFARQIADFVLRAQERLLDPDAMDALVRSSGRDRYVEVALFYRRYLDALALGGHIDFAGLLFQAVSLLQTGVTDEERYEHVLVDDYQDATYASEKLVEALARSARSLVVAADPATHVFGYRGGTLEPLSDLADALGADGTTALATSHRLGERARTLDSLSSDESPPAEAPGLQARLFAHPGEEVEAVAHELLRSRVDDDIAWSSMAVVLRRYGSYLTALRHALARHRIPYVVVAEAAAVASEPATRPVIDLLRYVFRPNARDELVERLLVSPVVGLDPHQLRRLRREARKSDRTLRSFVEEADLPSLPDDSSRALWAFRSLLREIPAVARDQGPEAVFFALWNRLDYFRELVASEDPGSQRELDALSALGEVLSRFSARRPGATIQDYLDALDAAEFGPDPWISPEERYPQAVRIVSAHGTQGLEFDAVMVVGCVEGEFPNLSQGDPMVSLDELVQPATPTERLAARLGEERALFRLAISRARRRTVLFASTSAGARAPRTPSRFVDRLGAGWTSCSEEDLPAASPRTMETSLRRRLADPSQGPARRLAAAAALARIGARPVSWWGRRDWTDPGVPLYEGEIKTSYSRLSAIENCPLQYLYSVEIGLDPDQSYHMWLGSQVHSVIDRVQRGEIEKSPEAMHAVLDAEWRKEVFPNRAVEHRKYLDARDMLERWLQHESADPIRSEVWFEFPIDGAMIRGRIDAIFQMNNGHARVVDYKTGMYAPTDEQAKKDLQLAAYYLALKRAPELSGLPEPGYLQLAYIARPHSTEGFVRRKAQPNAQPGYEPWAEESIRTLLEKIRGESFAPSPEADCRNCAFKTICPRWPQGADVPIAAGRT